ncbi:hypothetical protein ACFO0A_05835 [Novosphingobium tardum]|uniref:RcnB family protein n=1 Tax=Novosphingobium tardum TaxID=1538021 RepID=A0ABV8RN95_9SPHN
MRKLIIGAAAIALAGGALHADPGGGKGGGNPGGGHGNAGGHAAAGPAVEHGNGNGNANKGGGKDVGPGNAHVSRGNGGNDHAVVSRGAEKKAQAATSRAVERGNFGKAIKGPQNDRGVQAAAVRRDDSKVKVAGTNLPYSWHQADSHGLIDGCPPGLAKKNNGCQPPGQVRVNYPAYNDTYYRPDWWGYSGYNDGRYGYYDGYLLRMNDSNSVLGYIPLLGGALGIGNTWPSYYASQPLPPYYQDYYGLTPNGYRYADDALYGIDPQTNAITSIVALLTGQDISVGQPLPTSYDVYNVPYSYRDRYADGPDSLYRYSDGYVYQVDPTTRLVQTAIQLLT